MKTHTHTHTHTHMHAHTHTHCPLSGCSKALVFVCVSVYVCVCMSISVCVCVCVLYMCVCICVCASNFKIASFSPPQLKRDLNILKSTQGLSMHHHALIHSSFRSSVRCTALSQVQPTHSSHYS